MIASKVICDDTYSNRSWSIVGQGMFALREINQMEREMCSYLEWQLNIEPNALKEFEAKVRRDFKGLGPYPMYVLLSPAPSPMPSTTPYNAQTGGTAHTPSFAAHSQHPPSTSPPKPIPPPVPVYAGPPPSPTATPPVHTGTPDTPELSMSDSTSPASILSPSTPLGYEDHAVRVVAGEAMEIDSGSPTAASHMSGTTTIVSASAATPNAPSKLKVVKTGDIYARASPCVW
ncbi:hypothetical protein GSI_04091 [Ganoderma sinense ZZ0214-1]|uniref:Cyclin N-terminal domain-containing protein n=1 Tax=Ganoderma sinense ZZ0214-1 TaxID=1077348 RepID=A0A2G8SIT6_9APHY|nr:hypothetical protein GSI_04091 [Ganoderma sinense ZZ0214-1]